MGSALIDVMRARFAPSRLSRSWSQALRPTEAERFARQVSLRWEQAAAELEELIRARGWEPALEDTAEMEDPGSAGAPPARLDLGAAPPRPREAGPPRADPARATRSSLDREAATEGRPRMDPFQVVGQGLESWNVSGEPAVDAPPRVRGATAEPLLEPGLPGSLESADPMPPLETRGRPRSEERVPSRRPLGADGGNAPGRRVDRAPAWRDPSDLEGVQAVVRGSLETGADFPRRHGGGPLGEGASARPGRGFPASEESPRSPRRAGGPGAPAVALGNSRRSTPPEPRLDILIEEARRRAEALEDWERTGF